MVLVNPSFGTRKAAEKLAPYVSWLVRSRPSIGGDIKKPGVEEPANDRTPVVAGASVVKLWKVVTADFDRITAPVRMYRSVEDHVVDDLSAQLLQDAARLDRRSKRSCSRTATTWRRSTTTPSRSSAVAWSSSSS